MIRIFDLLFENMNDKNVSQWVHIIIKLYIGIISIKLL